MIISVLLSVLEQTSYHTLLLFGILDRPPDVMLGLLILMIMIAWHLSDALVSF